MNLRNILFCIGLLSFGSTGTLRGDVYDLGPDPRSNLVSMADDGLESVQDTESADLVAAIQALKAEADGAPLKLEQTLPVLRRLARYTEERFGGMETPFATELVGSVNQVLRFYSGAEIVGDRPSPANWRLVDSPYGVRLSPEVFLDFEVAFWSRCEDPDSVECRQASRDAVDALAVVLIMQAVLEPLVHESLEKVHALADRRLKQWDAYFNQSIPQWPWELALVNGPIYGRSIRNEKGLAEPPTWQVIVLHPDVAMEYVEAAEDGSQFQAAAMVEILGINLWSWDAQGDQKGPWGLSFPVGAGVVATFTDRQGVEDIGYGGILHINHIYNLGVTVRDSETGYFLSVNLAKLFEDKKAKAERYLGEIGL